MRKSLVVIILLLISSISFAADVKKEPTNYFGVHFGISKEEFVKEFGPESAWKPGKNPFVDVDSIESTGGKDLPLEIAVDFYKNRLFGICTTWKNMDKNAAMNVLLGLIEKYGVADTIEEEKDKNVTMSWIWQSVVATALYSIEKEAIFFAISDKVVSKKVVEESKKKGKLELPKDSGKKPMKIPGSIITEPKERI